MNKEQRELVRRAVEGQNLLSLRYFPYFISFLFFASLSVDNISSFSRDEQILWVLAKAGGCVALGVFFFQLRRLWIVGAMPHMSMSSLAVVSGIGGAIQGAVTGTLVDIFDLTSKISLTSRLTTGFFFSLTWLPINAVLVSVIANFREQRVSYFQRSEQMNTITFEQSGLAHTIRKAIEVEVASELQWSRNYAESRFQESIDEFDTAEINAKLIKEYAQQDLREFAHKLWQRSAVEQPSTAKAKEGNLRTIWDLFRMSLYLPPLDSSIYGFVLLTLIFPQMLRGHSFVMQIQSFLLVATIFFSILFLGDILYKRNSRYRPIILIVRTFGAIILPFFAGITLNNPIATTFHSRPRGFIFMFIVMLIGIDVLLAISKSVLYSQDQQIAAFHNSLGVQKAQINLANLEIAMVSRRWAQYIHGTLASQLISCAAILESSASSRDVQLKEAAVAEALRIMDGTIKGPEWVERNLLEETLYKIHLWKPIIDITVDCSVDQDLKAIPIEKFGLAIEEGIANAFRHGQASKIKISLHLVGATELEVTITDNGSGMEGSSKSGLGSSLFDALAAGNWSRSTGPDGVGTLLRMVIPVIELPPAGGGSSVG